MQLRASFKFLTLACFAGVLASCATVPRDTLYIEAANINSEPQSFEQALASQNYITIDMQQLTSGHQTVMTTINGQSRAFIVDTGAGMTFINQADLGLFSLSASNLIGAQSGSGVGGTIGISIYNIDTISLGGQAFAFDQISSTNLELILSEIEKATNTQISGIMGQDFLSRYNAIIDVKAHRLFLRID
ncbi:MAG: aspartyl protease family protein [Maricaulaceae bacterium]